MKGQTTLLRNSSKQKMRRLVVLLTALIVLMLSQSTQAKVQDLCTKGSDSECSRFGANMCCARIQYVFKGEFQDFHACASRVGIEWSEGKIYDGFGFDGNWNCAFALPGVQAMSTALGLALLTCLSF